MKATLISILVVIVLIGGATILGRGNSRTEENINNVEVIDGRQIITIQAKGGYVPRRTMAQAGIPTTLRFSTNGTYDCSSVLRLPSLGYLKNLPNSGTTDISIGSPEVSTFRGSCGMGMYHFEIEFKS
ncbi:MAG: cupredoxin domain-containing protein [Parcubacteria group bacterium]